MARLEDGVEVPVLHHSQPLHLEGLVVRDGHPGVHLCEAGVGVHEEVLRVVDEDVRQVLEADLQVALLRRLHIVV